MSLPRGNGSARPDRRRRAILVLGLVFAVLAAACGGDDDAPSGADDEAVDPDGVLRVAVDLTASGGLGFDPTRMAAGQYQYSLPVLGTLLERQADGSFTPGLAERVTSSDPRSIEIVLRPGLVFSDGTPLDADAVKATVERNIASKNSAGLQVAELAFIESMTSDGDRELTVKLKTPVVGQVYPLLAGVEFAPMSPGSFTSGADLNRQPVAAGRFRITSYEPGAKVVFERNERHWAADDVALAGIEYIHVTAGAATLNALAAGQVDWAVLSGDQIDAVSGPVEVSTAPTVGPLYLNVCMTRPPLDDVRVRRALNYATDREAINDAVFGGRSEPAWDLWPSGNAFHDPSNEENYPHDPERARRLLGEAGYPNGIQFNVFTPTTTGDVLRVLEILQAQWQEAGIRIGLVPTANAGADFFQNVRELGNMYPNTRTGLDKVTRNFASTAFANVCKFPAPEVDRLVAEISALPTDSEEALELWADLNETVVEDYVFGVNTVFQLSAIAYNGDRVGGLAFDYDSLGNRQPASGELFIKQR